MNGGSQPLLKHFVVTGIPKSGTLYLARSVSMNLNLNPTFEFRIGSRGFTKSQVQADRLEELINGSARVLQEHIAPTEYNLSLLKFFGLNKFVLTLRDPRDVICSLRFHLHREDARKPWHISMSQASGLIDESFYGQPVNVQFDILIANAFPRLQSWTAAWIRWLDDPELDIHLVCYEYFSKNNEAAVRAILQFFGNDCGSAIVLPRIEPSIKGIDLSTHFRKGQPGSFREELSQQQLQRLAKMIDHKLYKRMSWEA